MAPHACCQANYRDKVSLSTLPGPDAKPMPSTFTNSPNDATRSKAVDYDNLVKTNSLRRLTAG